MVEINIPEPEILDVEPEEMDLDIYYEDRDIIVVNKPKGMVVHPGPGHFHGTLVNGLLAHCKDLSGINGVLRPGIVHRLDKDTSGLLVAAKNDEAHEFGHSAHGKNDGEKYRALVHGVIPDHGTIDARLAAIRKTDSKWLWTTETFCHAFSRFGKIQGVYFY